MMTDQQPTLLTEDTDEALVLKLAEAYNHAETPESEAWVRVITAKTILLLTEQSAKGEPSVRSGQDDAGEDR